MFHNDDKTSVPSLPAPGAVVSEAETFATIGNSATGMPATTLTADFVNTVQSELLNVVRAGGITPSKTNNNQLTLAIQNIVQNIISGVSGEEFDPSSILADLIRLQAEIDALKNQSPGESDLFLEGMCIPFSGTFSGKHPIRRSTGLADTSWAICDGTNGTPDLTGKFVMGGTVAGATGGSSTHAHTASSSSSGSVSGNVGSTTLTAAQMPSHNHNGTYTKSQLASGGGSEFWGYYGITLGGGNWTPLSNAISSISSNVVAQGSGTAHTHSLSSTSVSVSTTTTVNSASNLPPYYTLAYIMKIS